MKNKVNISYSNNNMLLLFKVTPNRIGISIISFLLILEIGTIFYLATQISKEDSNIIIPIFLQGSYSFP